MCRRCNIPNLVYPTGDFVPFTKILSSEVNGKFNAITALLNVTKLNYVNVQTNNLLYASQLSSQVAVTDTLGYLTLVTTLPLANGGLGFSPVLTSLDANKVVAVNTAGTALTISNLTEQSTGKMYAWNHFL